MDPNVLIKPINGRRTLQSFFAGGVFIENKTKYVLHAMLVPFNATDMEQKSQRFVVAANSVLRMYMSTPKAYLTVLAKKPFGFLFPGHKTFKIAETLMVKNRRTYSIDQQHFQSAFLKNLTSSQGTSKAASNTFERYGCYPIEPHPGGNLP